MEISEEAKQRIQALRKMRDSNEHTPDDDRIEDYLIDTL